MNIALILAGGKGSRLGGDIPKQYLKVDGRMIISYCLETFLKHEKIDQIRIVAEAGWRETILCCLEELDENMSVETALVAKRKMQGFSEPGENRQLSIWNGLKDMKKDCAAEDVVIIHDAARPLVSNRIITECLETCGEHDGALTVLPVKDTIYYGKANQIESLLDRNRLMAGQAPEAFRLGKYMQANERLLPDEILKINGSTEPAILAGMDIGCVAGEEQNFKITTKADLERFEQILSAGKEQ